MQSYDVMANAEMCVPEYGGSCEHHHAYTSNGTECIQSGHCAILIKVEQGGPVMFDETDHGDYDLYLPLVDDDGNEVEDGRAQ